MQVKRLDAQTVAPENKFAFAGIPNCEGKHATEFFDKTLTIFLVEMKDNFRVRRGAEGMAALLELGAQFAGIVSLIAAALPVLLLVLIWKGLTSPGIATGVSYSNYHAEVGIAWFRPVVVTLFAAIYLVPYSFPAMWQVSLKRRWPALLSAVLVGLVAASFKDSFLELGLLHTLVGAASRIPAGGALLFWLITSVATYNAVAVCLLLWAERSRLRTCVPVDFALFVVFFFIAEQLRVGGNIPFYDRYILQLAPFLGLIGFWLSPKFTWSRILSIVGMAAVSQATLWQHAIIERVAH